MDGDLQDRPEEIPRFVAEYERGYDVVYATRVRRKESLPLRASYFLFYRLMTPAVRDRRSGRLRRLRACSRDVSSIRSTQLPERHSYVRGLRTWVGFHADRAFRSSATRARAASRATRSGSCSGSRSTACSRSRSHHFAQRGSSARARPRRPRCTRCTRSSSASSSATRRKGFTALIVAITFFAGVQLLFLGLIGEYLGRVYDEAKGRPNYVVADVVRSRACRVTARRPGSRKADGNHSKRVSEYTRSLTAWRQPGGAIERVWREVGAAQATLLAIGTLVAAAVLSGLASTRGGGTTTTAPSRIARSVCSQATFRTETSQICTRAC